MNKLYFDEITEADAILKATSVDDETAGEDAEFCGFDEDGLAIYRSESGFPW